MAGRPGDHVLVKARAIAVRNDRCRRANRVFPLGLYRERVLAYQKLVARAYVRAGDATAIDDQSVARVQILHEERALVGNHARMAPRDRYPREDHIGLRVTSNQEP